MVDSKGTHVSEVGIKRGVLEGIVEEMKQPLLNAHGDQGTVERKNN